MKRVAYALLSNLSEDSQSTLNGHGNFSVSDI